MAYSGYIFIEKDKQTPSTEAQDIMPSMLKIAALFSFPSIFAGFGHLSEGG